MPLYEFIMTVYRLSEADRRAELTEYFKLIREILAMPRAILTLGKPQDKKV